MCGALWYGATEKDQHGIRSVSSPQSFNQACFNIHVAMMFNPSSILWHAPTTQLMLPLMLNLSIGFFFTLFYMLKYLLKGIIGWVFYTIRSQNHSKKGKFIFESILLKQIIPTGLILKKLF